MTSVLDGASISIPNANAHTEASCPFCSEKPEKHTKVNKLNNDASALGNDCMRGDVLGTAKPNAGGPAWTVQYTNPVSSEEKTSDVRVNPHHCIPGKEALKGDEYQSPLLEFVEKDKGFILGDIGYEVNKYRNGIWLPTILEHFYDGYPEDEPLAGMSWGALTKKYPSEQFTMAEAAMQSASRQFHDRHHQYSVAVRKRLSSLKAYVIGWQMRCPFAKDKEKPNIPPPYGLIARLDALSKFLAGFLIGDPRSWRDPYWTSRHAEKLHAKLSQLQAK